MLSSDEEQADEDVEDDQQKAAKNVGFLINRVGHRAIWQKKTEDGDDPVGDGDGQKNLSFQKKFFWSFWQFFQKLKKKLFLSFILDKPLLISYIFLEFEHFLLKKYLKKFFGWFKNFQKKFFDKKILK